MLSKFFKRTAPSLGHYRPRRALHMPQILEPFEPRPQDLNEQTPLQDSTYEKIAKKFKKPMQWAKQWVPSVADSFKQAAKSVGYETRTPEQLKADAKYFEEIWQTHEIEATLGVSGQETLDAKAFLETYPSLKQHFIDTLRHVNYEWLEDPAIKEWQEKDPTNIPFEKEDLLDELDQKYQFPELPFPDLPVLPDYSVVQERIKSQLEQNGILEVDEIEEEDAEALQEIQKVETSRLLQEHLDKMLADAPGSDVDQKMSYVQKKVEQSTAVVEEWIHQQQIKLLKKHPDYEEHLSKLEQLRADIHDKLVYPKALRIAREGYMRSAELLEPQMPYDSFVQQKMSRIFGILNIEQDEDVFDTIKKYDFSIGEDDIEWAHPYPPPLHTYEEIPLLKEYLAPAGEPWYDFMEDETVLVSEDFLKHGRENEFLAKPRSLPSAIAEDADIAFPPEFDEVQNSDDIDELDNSEFAKEAYLIHNEWNNLERSIIEEDYVEEGEEIGDDEDTTDAYFDKAYEAILPAQSLPSLEELIMREEPKEGEEAEAEDKTEGLVNIGEEKLSELDREIFEDPNEHDTELPEQNGNGNSNGNGTQKDKKEGK
eukprot:TRINITY_DN2673_c0_g1_i1.p1 TRINITY_DN2673_c0_g1~~TRINITY_DN2673_c0_g1_i1.p1  ORF type:complete len:595 (-),score=150.38 TRINITY_DN2673_c0_g1_i1:131-1915(-)